MKKCLLCCVILTCFAVNANAALNENFESYALGKFITQSGVEGTWYDPVGSASSTWQIVDFGGSRCLKQPNISYSSTRAADLLEYADETFDSASGYTIMMKMYLPSNEPNAGVEAYSGWLYDGYDQLDADGTTPYIFPYLFSLYSNRFYPADGGKIENGSGGTALVGSYAIQRDTWVYFRQYRQGSNVAVWVSTSPMTAANPGTMVVSGASPAKWGDGSIVPLPRSIYLFGLGPVYFDDLVFATGNALPDVPKFSPAWQYISGPTNITITVATAGATIRYTTDGTTPTPTHGTVIASGGTVTVSPDTTLKAKFWKDAIGSPVTSVTYTEPIVYNEPEAIAYTPGPVSVNGDLSEWAGVNWVPLSQVYDGTPSDIAEAYYATKWCQLTNKIYVAVKVRDTTHKFTDSYMEWNARDAIELYFHVKNSGATNYLNFQDTAQEYTVGIKNSNPLIVWTGIGYKKAISSASNFEAAGSVSGQWLYYEAGITPFELFGDFLGQTSVPAILNGGDVVGLDVVVVGNNGSYTGMKSENLGIGKNNDWSTFGIHHLATVVAGCGDSQHPYPTGDFNHDCQVNLKDFAILAGYWTDCTDPNPPCSYMF